MFRRSNLFFFFHCRNVLTHFCIILDEEYTEEASLSVAVISLVICVVGIVGNAVAIFVIISLKEYQKSITHW